MINKVEFMNLALGDRIRMVLRTGLYLNDNCYTHFRLQLYSISDFFVEVKIITDSCDVESVRVVSGEDAEKFSIELADLLSYP